jgi:hypothetical protein
MSAPPGRSSQPGERDQAVTANAPLPVKRITGPSAAKRDRTRRADHRANGSHALLSCGALPPRVTAVTKLVAVLLHDHAPRVV